MYSATFATSTNARSALVTGGAGFIGSHLCAHLLDAGLAVTCVDNFSSGRNCNVEHLLEREGFTLLEGDVTDAGLFREVGAPDMIFNLACPASPTFYQADPVHTMKTSVLGALNALELARSCNARILQTSTSEVYGDPNEHPQREEYRGNVSITGPRACYDEGKRAAETLFFDYARSYGTDIRVVRIFNTYGPHMRPDDGRVVSNFIWQALLGHDITIYGDGSQTRSFCYVDDLVDGLLRMMTQDSLMGPVNLGNPCESTVMELAQMVLEMIGGDSRIIFKGLPTDDPKRRKPDISLARQELGWKPHTQLEDGLRTTIAYFEGLMQ